MDSKFVCPFFFVKAAGLLVDEQQRIVTPLIKVNMRVSHNISELKCRNCAHPRLLLALLRTVQQPERDLQLSVDTSARTHWSGMPTGQSLLYIVQQG
jgi:hypothetical protein